MATVNPVTGLRYPDVGDRPTPIHYPDGTLIYPVAAASAPPVNRPFTREVGGFELDKADLKGHPAACPDDVMERLRTAALKLGLSIQIGARKYHQGMLGRPRDGTWERYIEVTDERLPERLRVQVTTLRHDEEWADAARRIGLWPTR